jgi:anthranilate synthase component 1
MAEPPVVVRFPSDLVTPVRAFLALTQEGEDSFLLESVAGGESQARYSFLGFRPSEIFESGDCASVRRGDNREELPGPPEEAFGAWVASFARGDGAPPVPFLGGAVGWMDFSCYAFAEPVLKPTFPAAREQRMVFGHFTSGLVLDHLRQEGYLYRFPQAGEGAIVGRMILDDLRRKLEGAVPPPQEESAWVPEYGPVRERFSRSLASIQGSIVAGDAYQVVLSEPFAGSFEGNPFEVYRRLRRLNPSPYHFYISLGGRQVVGASPEMMVRVEGRRATTVPIAGTRRRGVTGAEDAALEHELLADPKELAEHAMLVDLARNDLGRVCAYGSVEVPVRGVVERFSHVMHMTSEVQGNLAPGHTSLDALAATFPAGTVSGAPKIRAVQLLSQLEGMDRGVYGGAVGIVDGAGNLETCIAIRTLEFEGGKVTFRVGAGIVADSKDDAEWDEIHRKAGALLAALEGSDFTGPQFAARQSLSARGPAPTDGRILQ